MKDAPQHYENFRSKSKEEPTPQQLSRWKNQEKKVFACFFQEPRTMYQVEKLTEVMRPNICRFVAVWKKRDAIRVVRSGKDPYTRCTAQFLSTNPELWPKPEPVKVDRYGQTIMFQ